MVKFRTTFLFLFLSVSVFGQKKKMADTTCLITVPQLLQVNGSDKLMVKIGCQVNAFDFQLYDKYGKLIYAADKLTFPLDFDIYERINGNQKPKYPSGNYYWRAEYELNNGTKKSHKGEISLFSNP